MVRLLPALCAVSIFYCLDGLSLFASAHRFTPIVDQILQKLQIIPGTRLAQHAHKDATIQYGGAHQAHRRTKRDVDFEVYKPGGAFKKRQPGMPDYRVVVTRYVMTAHAGVKGGTVLQSRRDF